MHSALLLGCLCAATGQAQNAPPPAKDSVAAADAAEDAAEAKDQILVVGHRQFGAVATAIQRITGAMNAAIGSGDRSANCLGTSSPMISDA